MDQGSSRRPETYTRNYRQFRNAESGRDSLPQGKGHPLINQYQMVNSENTHMSDIIQTEQVVFVYLGIYVYAIKNGRVYREETEGGND